MTMVVHVVIRHWCNPFALVTEQYVEAFRSASADPAWPTIFVYREAVRTCSKPVLMALFGSLRAPRDRTSNAIGRLCVSPTTMVGISIESQ